jgi:hypothetical protein
MIRPSPRPATTRSVSSPLRAVRTIRKVVAVGEQVDRPRRDQAVAPGRDEQPDERHRTVADLGRDPVVEVEKGPARRVQAAFDANELQTIRDILGPGRRHARAGGDMTPAGGACCAPPDAETPGGAA